MGQRHPSLAQQVLDFRYEARVLSSRAVQQEAECAAHRAKSAAAHKAGNESIARTHARSLITARNTAATFYAMSSRLDALASKLVAVEATTSLAQQMQTLSASLRSTVSKRSFVDLGVSMEAFDKAMTEIEKAAGLSERGIDAHMGLDEADVDRELEHIHDDAGMQLEADMPRPPSAVAELDSVQGEAMARRLEDRFAALNK